MQLSISQTITGSILIGLITLFSCCKKDVLSPAEQMADRIEGTFALTQITWEGAPVDLNGDEIANNNLYEELLSLPTNQINIKRHVIRNNFNGRYQSRHAGSRPEET